MTPQAHSTQGQRSQHARSVELEVALTGTAQAQVPFVSYEEEKGGKETAKETNTVLLLPSAQEDSSTVEDS